MPLDLLQGRVPVLARFRVIRLERQRAIVAVHGIMVTAEKLQHHSSLPVPGQADAGSAAERGAGNARDCRY